VEAARSGSRETVDTILSAKAKIDEHDKEGKTALIASGYEGHTALAAFLLDQKADIRAKDVTGATALHAAAARGQTETVKLLLDRKLSVKEKDNLGRTPLVLAAANGHYETADLLVARGSDLKAKAGDGQTALLAALYGIANYPGNVQKERAALVDMLIEHGSDIKARDACRLTPVMYAAEQGKVDLIADWLKRGVELNARDVSGRTALGWAILRSHDEAAAYLRKVGGVE
jgi:ankyrin repeat protein